MTSSEPSPLRASDAERHAVVAVLHDAVARGLLTLAEGDERMGAAYSARFVRDLPPLTADLPPASPPAPVAPGWRALMTLAWLQLRMALTGLTWRRASSRPRLAVAVLALVAVLSIGAVTAGGFGDHRPDVQQRFDQFGPR
ncbi:MAG: DUF1707 SHOCT-like domain-containing protein [Blastococcus sp.]